MILCANNEYSNLDMMFPAVARREDFTAAQAATAIASTGVSVVALEKTAAGWTAVKDAHVNRRITPFTPALFSGPLRGAIGDVCRHFRRRLTIDHGTFRNTAVDV